MTPSKRNIKNLRFLAFLFMFLASIRFAFADPVDLDGIDGEYELSSHLELLEDQSRTLDLSELLSSDGKEWFQAGGGRVPSFGYTESAFWVRFRLFNSSLKPVDNILELAYPTVNELDLYIEEGGGWFRHVDSGMEHSFSTRDYNYHNFLFDLHIPAETEITVYLRFFSLSSSLIPLILWEPDILLNHIIRNQYILGTIAGAFLILILYNAFLYLSLRDRSYLYYILFLVSSLFYQLGVTGFTYQMLWPESYYWGDRSLAFFVYASIGTVSLFTMEILELKKRVPLMFRLFQIQTALAMFGTALVFLIDYSLSVYLSTVWAGISTLFIFCSSCYFYFKRIPHAA